MKKHISLTLAGAASALLAPLAPGQVHIPTRPEQISYRPLEFTAPKASEYRTELASGTPVYMAPSDEFPLITVTFSFKGGAYLEPDERTGLASMTGAMIRRGGSETVSAEELDEDFDFLAANVNVGVGSTTAGASLNSLSSNFDEAFALFMDMLVHPGFASEKVELYRNELVENMKQRNDDAQGILNREWDRLLYGEDHFEGRAPTIDTINAITVADLHAFHRQVFHPGNLIIGVTGDFDQAAMLAKLEKALSGWERRGPIPDPPAPNRELESGIYHVEKDIPQGKVYIGHRGVQRDDPDYFSLLVMNDILGGGGFTSRLVSRVRSDEGLAYSVGSRMQTPPYYPGEFRALFQSKNRTVALATKIILEEINRIRTEPVSEQELETSKRSFIETFPRRFESKQAMIGTFIDDEWTHRSPGYWETFRDKVKAVTAADVQQAAQRHLHPDELAILVVGKWDEIQPGDLEGRATMAEFFDGKYEEIPLRDPLTLKPMNKK